MDVFLMVRRQKLTLFLDAKETTRVADLKRMIEGITKQPADQMRLYNRDEQVSKIIEKPVAMMFLADLDELKS